MDFESIYTSNYKLIYKYLLRLTRCHDSSNDLTQEVFEKMYMQIIAKKEQPKDTKSWLYKVAYNLFVNQYKKQQIEGIYQHEKKYLHNRNATEIPDEKDEKQTQLEKGLAKLGDDEYHLLMLYQEGLKYREIAEVLNMKTSSVGKTLSRTIEKLRTLIKEECHELFEK